MSGDAIKIPYHSLWHNFTRWTLRTLNIVNCIKEFAGHMLSDFKTFFSVYKILINLVPFIIFGDCPYLTITNHKHLVDNRVQQCLLLFSEDGISH
jgi:hypothetical protein